MEPCCITGCETLAAIRGLCKRHYDLANQSVRQQRTTWEALESAGEARPRRYRLFRPVWCEVCDERKSQLTIDLNTDEQSGPLMWWVCHECSEQLAEKN